MRLSSSASLARSMFSIDTHTMMEGRNSSSSISPARPGPTRQRSPLEVDEAYGRAFSTRSFLDLWSHANRSLRHTFFSSYKLSSRPSPSFKDEDAAAAMDEPSCSYTILDGFILEPSPEALGHSGHRRRRRWRLCCRHRRRRVEALLLEYFDVTREACVAWSALLAAAGAARRNHLVLRRLLHRLDSDGSEGAAAARDVLERHVRLDNPLSPAGGRLARFRDAHTRCAPLSRRLAAGRRRLRRLARAARFAQCAAATAIVGASAATVVAAVVLAAHAVVGVGAAAALTFCATGTTRPVERQTSALEKHTLRRRQRAEEEDALDAAARGAFIVGRDLDTVSRMVRRAHDELEHGRDMARIAVDAAGPSGERPPQLLLQEVAREEEECREDLRCQLEELEEYACLCLLTINRSRRMVAHEMTARR